MESALQHLKHGGINEMGGNSRQEKGYKVLIVRQDTEGDETIVHTGPCVLHRILVTEHTTTYGNVIVYDGVDNTGTALVEISIADDETYFVPADLCLDAQITTGIFVEFDGTAVAGSLTVIYI